MVTKKPHVGAIIQARCGSSRLPGKVLMPIPFEGHKSILAHIVERALCCKTVSDVIIATSKTSVDDQIQIFAEKNNYYLYRGSENDVLSRFYEASKKHLLDVIVRLTGDNPCIDPSYIDSTVEYHIQTKADYTKSEGLPVGMNVEVISFSALERASKEAKKDEEREHVTPYLRTNPTIFSLKEIKYNTNNVFSDLRLTVDYASDYALVNLLYQYFSHLDRLFELKDIEHIISNQAWLKTINQDNYQKKIFATVIDELKEGIIQLNRCDLPNAANVLKEKVNTITYEDDIAN